MGQVKQNPANPLGDIINDEVYSTLKNEGLLDRKAVRDYQIQIRFRELRQTEMTAIEAIKVIFMEYPDLDFNTINKIVYTTGDLI
ncbi:MAG: hypothetical protein ACM34K_16985 [Bacillota bacterium]